MKAMNNAKVIKAMEKQTLQKYLDRLVHSDLHKITLFGFFSQTGAPNLSDPQPVVLINNPEKLTTINSGAVFN